MASTLTAAELEKQFPSNKKITARPYDAARAFEQARMGEDCGNIAYMLPGNVPVVNALVKNRIENGFDLEKEEDRLEYASRLRLTTDSQQAREEMAAFRTFTITNDVMASPFALAAFLITDLSPDELPMIERPRSRNHQRFTVRSQSIDGGSRQAQWSTTKSVATFELESVATDRVNYPIMDIQQGDISESQNINVELQYDMDMKIDALALANVDALQAATGLRALMSFHPSVQQANVPDGNYLDLDAAFPGNPDVLTIDKLKAILNHIALLQAAFPGLTIQTIMASPLNMRDSWDFIDLVSGVGSATEGVAPGSTVPKGLREQIFNGGGMITSAWGFNWTWTTNTQIAKGRMYVFMNKPVGWMFTKRSMDRTFVWNESNSIDHAESNMGEVLMRRVFSFVTVDLWKFNILIIDL